jgi:hypothetical protein
MLNGRRSRIDLASQATAEARAQSARFASLPSRVTNYASQATFLIDTVAIRNHSNWLKTNDRDPF